MTSMQTAPADVNSDLDTDALNVLLSIAADADRNATLDDALAADALEDDALAAEYEAWLDGFNDVDPDYYRDLGREPLPS